MNQDPPEKVSSAYHSTNTIKVFLRQGFDRYFSDPETIVLLFILIGSLVILQFLGKFLLPIIISIVIAYLLASGVRLLERCRLPHAVAAIFIYCVFLGVLALGLFFLLPILWKQLIGLSHELPRALNKMENYLNQLNQYYPHIIPEHPLLRTINYLEQQSAYIGRVIVSFSIATIPSIIEMIIYFILIPLLVFFFLKDRRSMSQLLSRFLPQKKGFIYSVYIELQKKIGAYVKGRALEIIITSSISSIAFSLLKLPYTFLLSILLGLSVIIPYIGALIMTIPFIIVSLMAWGISSQFTYTMIAYWSIIAFDANLLVPLLFSEALSLHPVEIIIAILLFGGIWGFWGIFFAIPLAILLKAILKMWPRQTSDPYSETDITKTENIINSAEEKT